MSGGVEEVIGVSIPARMPYFLFLSVLLALPIFVLIRIHALFALLLLPAAIPLLLDRMMAGVYIYELIVIILTQARNIQDSHIELEVYYDEKGRKRQALRVF